MSKEETIKCRYCGKIHDKATAYKVGKSTYYCSLLCQNSATQKRIKKEQKNYKSIKGTDRRLVTDKIVDLYHEKGIDDARIPWELISSQMKNMLDEHKDWNYMTLYYVMWYMKELLGIDLLNEKANTPLSLVPFYVIEAKDYYSQTQNINIASEQFIFSEPKVIKATNRTKTRPYKKIEF